MRRGRNYGAIAALIAALGIGVAMTPGVASAASPQDICNALAAGTYAAADYTPAELAAYTAALTSDPTIQGYCSPLPVIPPVPSKPATPPAGGGNVAPATQVVVPTAGVKGAAKTKTAPQTGAAPAATQRTTAAPLGTTRTTGTLPFTGIQLAVFAIVGLGLLAGGFLLRMTSRQKRTHA